MGAKKKVVAKGTAALLDAALSAFAAGVERSAIRDLVLKREEDGVAPEAITDELAALASAAEEEAQKKIDEATRAASVKV